MSNHDDSVFNVILAGRANLFHHFSSSRFEVSGRNVRVHNCHTCDELALLLLETGSVVMIAIDIMLAEPDLNEFVSNTRKKCGIHCKLILVSDFSITIMARAINGGFNELMAPPLEKQQILALLKSSLRHQNNSGHLTYLR